MYRAMSALLVASGLVAPAAADEPAFAPKVLVVTMFGGEAKPWVEGEPLTRKIAVPGLSPAYPAVACTDAGLCVMTTGMGFANAASSLAAVLFSRQFDLTRTYVIIAGIAGIDPAKGTLGSAAWARWAVDGGLQHEIDPREAPPDWPAGYFAFGAAGPGQKGELNYGSEVFRLDEDLLQAAFKATRNVELADDDAAKAYRARYGSPPASAPPVVTICDTISSDTWWFGARLEAAMEARARLATDGAADPCTTQQEDNATLAALKRGAQAGLVDFSRVAVLRAGADFDREPPGQGAVDALNAKTGGYPISVANAYRVAGRLAQEISSDWAAWSAGPPK